MFRFYFTLYPLFPLQCLVYYSTDLQSCHWPNRSQPNGSKKIGATDSSQFDAPNAKKSSAKQFSKKHTFEEFHLKCPNISSFFCWFVFYIYKYKTIWVFFEFFGRSKFHQCILKIFSANAASIEPSFLRQFCWNSDQNSSDSPNLRLCPREIYLRSIDSSKGLHRTNFAGSISREPTIWLFTHKKYAYILCV